MPKPDRHLASPVAALRPIAERIKSLHAFFRRVEQATGAQPDISLPDRYHPFIMTTHEPSSNPRNAPRNDPRPILRIGHSPDPDDAFMWWPLAELDGRPAPMDTGRFRFEPVLEDIETLNRRSMEGTLEITAMSCAQYPRVRHQYAVTACGASMGDAYGPKLVTRSEAIIDDLRQTRPTIAVPGRLTSAFATARLMLGEFDYEERPFDAILDDVASGRFDAGLIIHEGQLTYESHGLHQVADLGQWWKQQTGLPLPLGVNAIRRDLDDLHGPGTLAEVTATLKRSLEFALEHRHEALAYALRYARGMEADLADRFVEMYVNQWTFDFGPTGRHAVDRFLQTLSEAEIVESGEDAEFIAPAV